MKYTVQAIDGGGASYLLSLNNINSTDWGWTPSVKKCFYFSCLRDAYRATLCVRAILFATYTVRLIDDKGVTLFKANKLLHTFSFTTADDTVRELMKHGNL